MTAQDGAQLAAGQKEILDVVRQFSNRMASLQRNMIEILEVLGRIDTGLSETRVGRLEAELRETELERDLAERHLKALEEKLALKKDVSEKAVSTDEKIRQAAKTAQVELERQKKETDAAYWVDVRRGIVKTVLTTLAVSGVLATVAFVSWLIQLYVNR